MEWLIYLVLYFVQPLDTVEQEKMAAFMVRVNKKAMFTARPLVKAIYREAKAKKLDPTVLAGIVWNESWFDETAKGSSSERGPWQIWPWASPALDYGWSELKYQKRLKDFPRVSWKALPLRTRWRASLDPDVGTYLAVRLLSMLRSHCLRRKHDHRRPTDSYAHYNVGYRWPRPGYSRKLWEYTRRVRRAIGRPTVTATENAWMNRMVPGG